MRKGVTIGMLVGFVSAALLLLAVIYMDWFTPIDREFTRLIDALPWKCAESPQGLFCDPLQWWAASLGFVAIAIGCLFTMFLWRRHGELAQIQGGLANKGPLERLQWAIAHMRSEDRWSFFAPVRNRNGAMRQTRQNAVFLSTLILFSLIFFEGNSRFSVSSFTLADRFAILGGLFVVAAIASSFWTRFAFLIAAFLYVGHAVVFVYPLFLAGWISLAVVGWLPYVLLRYRNVE